MTKDIYSSFDAYLDTDTWHTSHPNDNERFYRALDRVVRNENFNPDKMGHYMRDWLKNQSIGISPDFERYIQDRVRIAWAIQEFLAISGRN